MVINNAHIANIVADPAPNANLTYTHVHSNAIVSGSASELMNEPIPDNDSEPPANCKAQVPKDTACREVITAIGTSARMCWFATS